MKNQNLKKLSIFQMRKIEGGSEVTDALWYGIGATVSFVKELYKSGPIRPSQYK